MSKAAGRTVLLVEDEPLLLKTTSALLSDEGYEVVTAGSFQQALEQLSARPEIAVLVTDISLSGDRDGIALAQHVAEHRPDIRTVIISGRERPTGDRYPAQAVFFTKPFAPGALLTIMQQLLAGEIEPRREVAPQA